MYQTPRSSCLTVAKVKSLIRSEGPSKNYKSYNPVIATREVIDLRGPRQTRREHISRLTVSSVMQGQIDHGEGVKTR